MRIPLIYAFLLIETTSMPQEMKEVKLTTTDSIQMESAFTKLIIYRQDRKIDSLSCLLDRAYQYVAFCQKHHMRKRKRHSFTK